MLQNKVRNTPNRMNIDVSQETQMAIRIAAIKNNVNVGSIVTQAVEAMFPEYVSEAKEALRRNK